MPKAFLSGIRSPFSCLPSPGLSAQKEGVDPLFRAYSIKPLLLIRTRPGNGSAASSGFSQFDGPPFPLTFSGVRKASVMVVRVTALRTSDILSVLSVSGYASVFSLGHTWLSEVGRLLSANEITANGRWRSWSSTPAGPTPVARPHLGVIFGRE